MAHNSEQAQDEGQTHESKQVHPLEAKNRYRRVKTLDENDAGIPEEVEAVSVCDREEDMAD